MFHFYYLVDGEAPLISDPITIDPIVSLKPTNTDHQHGDLMDEQMSILDCSFEEETSVVEDIATLKDFMNAIGMIAPDIPVPAAYIETQQFDLKSGMN